MNKEPGETERKWYSLSDLDGLEREHREAMAKVFRYDEKDGVMEIYPDGKGCGYPIELSRIPDPEGLVHWLEHLTGKSWFTGELVNEFINQVYSIKGWDLHRRSL